MLRHRSLALILLAALIATPASDRAHARAVHPHIPGRTPSHSIQESPFPEQSANTLPGAPDWTATSDQPDAWFGATVSTAGDVNGDGYADVIVGAPNYHNDQRYEGRAFLFSGSAAGLSATSGWMAEDNDSYAAFGGAVDTAGDVNGDGYADVIVGAPNYDNAEYYEGRAYVYYGSAAGLGRRANWRAEGNLANAGFGTSVSSAGDVNGDGYDDVIVGASTYTNGQLNEGRVYLYYGSAAGLSPTPAWSKESDHESASLGAAVDGVSDVNGDGYDDVIIGETYDSLSASTDGRVYLYYGSAGGLSATPIWSAPSHQWSGTGFVRALSAAGDVNGDG